MIKLEEVKTTSEVKNLIYTHSLNCFVDSVKSHKGMMSVYDLDKNIYNNLSSIKQSLKEFIQGYDFKELINESDIFHYKNKFIEFISNFCKHNMFYDYPDNFGFLFKNNLLMTCDLLISRIFKKVINE
jgi:hypothetical protein